MTGSESFSFRTPLPSQLTFSSSSVFNGLQLVDSAARKRQVRRVENETFHACISHIGASSYRSTGYVNFRENGRGALFGAAYSLERRRGTPDLNFHNASA